MNLYEFMATCNTKHRDPVATILKQEGVKGSNPILAEVLRIGFAEASKRPAYRKVLDAMMKKDDPKRYRAERAKDAKFDREVDMASAKVSLKFAERLTDAVVQLKKSLFKEFLVMGYPLGEATKETLLSAAAEEELISGNASKRAAFFGAVAAAMNPGDFVKDSVALSAVEAMHRRIFGKVGKVAA